MSFLDLFAQPSWALRIEQNQEKLMATVTEALAGWREYTDALKAQNTDLTAQLEAALATAQELRDTDAAEDAAQANALSDQIAQQISDALDAAKATPEAPPVVEEPVEESPAEEPDQPAEE